MPAAAAPTRSSTLTVAPPLLAPAAARRAESLAAGRVAWKERPIPACGPSTGTTMATAGGPDAGSGERLSNSVRREATRATSPGPSAAPVRRSPGIQVVERSSLPSAVARPMGAPPICRAMDRISTSTASTSPRARDAEAARPRKPVSTPWNAASTTIALALARCRSPSSVRARTTSRACQTTKPVSVDSGTTTATTSRANHSLRGQGLRDKGGHTALRTGRAIAKC